MKLESLVIVNQHVTVNDLSNFAHTAHHARRIVSAGHYLGLLALIYIANSLQVRLAMLVNFYLTLPKLRCG